MNDALGRRTIAGQVAGWWTRNPDLLAIALWLGLCALAGFSRREFTGDGVRHLLPILQFGHPRLGEPRWLLFPVFLFGLLRPLVSLRVLATVEGMTRAMMVLTLAAAAVYVGALRSWLVARQIPAARRAGALLMAGFTAGLLYAATDLMEPIFAAALAMLGLAAAARREGNPAATDSDRCRSALIAVSAIALASFLYQGVILAIALLPLAVSRRTLFDRRTIAGSIAILVAVPLVTTAILALGGNTVTHALERFSKGEENPLYRSYLKRPGVAPYVVALVAGPPQGVLELADFHGLNGLVKGLNNLENLIALLRLTIGFTAVWGFVLMAIRRRQLAIVVAVSGLLVLPVVRHQQYGYIKYYVMLPAILAVAAADLRPRAVIALAALFAFLNGGLLVARIARDRRVYEARVRLYEQASSSDCWMTMGWGPSIGFRWPGSVCAVLGSLSGGAGNDPESVIAQSHQQLSDCLRRCFCDAAVVYTDDMTEDGRALLADTARHFQFTSMDLGRTLLLPGEGVLRSTVPDTRTVYAYPRPAQERICALASITP